MLMQSTRKLCVVTNRTVALAAVLFVLAGSLSPAWAQRLSLSERVSRLEKAQQQQSTNSGVVLVNQVQALQAQIQQLQGQVEELQHQLGQLRQTSKDQYIDLDSRLRRLETASGPASPGSAPAAAASTVAAPKPPPASASTVSNPVATAVSPAAATSTAATASANPQAAQDAYNQAFTSLRNGQFVQSASQFRAFIQQYPQSTLAPNAYYWLGESYYTVQNYDVALKTFQRLIQLYPDSDKTPGALLKVGYCEDALNQTAAAQKTLQAVIDKYPGSTVAMLASQRLKDMALRQAH